MKTLDAPAQAPVASPAARSVRLGSQRYPLVLPSIRDPRLHLASVIISIHILGQLGLHFRVSIPQILVAILTCALIEVVWTFHRSRIVAWPASAMLTGSGVALILRVVGTEPGDHWTWHGWYVFAAVAGLSLLTKYVVKYRGSHVFNPSNVGLVAAFLILGSTRVEPLDFWWGPLDGWLVLAYTIILSGGLLITSRLKLLGMSAAFWVAFAAGLGVLAASGHCITARWSAAPVCGARFWWIVALSPEILIFLFFMITDPKTTPSGRVARITFGAAVGVASVLLIAPQTTEFSAKVALLSGLVVLCVVRQLVIRFLPGVDSDEDALQGSAGRLLRSPSGQVRPGHAFALGALGGFLVMALGAGIVLAGEPAREPTGDRVLAEAPPEVTAHVDPASLPPVSVDPDIADLSPELASGPGAQGLAATLAENLETETQALLDADSRLLTAVDYGDRLAELQTQLEEASASGTTTVRRYTFDALHLVPIVAPGDQSGLSLGFEARGTVEVVTYEDGEATGNTTEPFETTFMLSRPTGGRWLTMGTLPYGERTLRPDA
ncbi:MAG TPA: hypothetical protein VIE12_07640 [Actinomycetota bacterium]